MAKKKKIKRFSAVQAVKEMARQRIGVPPKMQVIADRKKRLDNNPKRKPTLNQLLESDDD